MPGKGELLEPEMKNVQCSEIDELRVESTE